MPNRKISELTLATSSLPTDGLVIQRGGSNFKLEASNFSTGGSSDTGSLVTTSSISGTTITFTKGDGSTYTNEIVSASYAITASHEVVHEVSSSYAETASFADRTISSSYAVTASYAVSASLAQLALEAISSSYAISASHAEISDEAISASYALTASHATSTAGTLSNGTSVDAFSFDGSTDATIDISTYSASVSTDRTNLSASLTTTDQTISSSVASLSGSASDARNQLAADYIAADTALSASLTTTDQTISASVASLSGSASDARNLIAGDLDTLSASFNERINDNDDDIAGLNTYTASLKQAISVSGPDITLLGDLTVQGTQSIIHSTEVSIDDNILSLNGTGATNGGIEVNDPSGPLSGSLLWDGANNRWIAGQSGSESVLLVADGLGILSSSAQIADEISGSSVAPINTLSGSASDARNQLATDYIAADTALSASLTTTDQTISSSVATLSGSASDARNALATDYIAADTALSASLTTTDQTISASVAALSASASTARDNIGGGTSALSSSASTAREEYINNINQTTQNAFDYSYGNGTSGTVEIGTGSFVKTVNAVGPDASGNVAVSLASVETGLSSSFPSSPTDGDVYVISGETATDRTGSNGQSFIYSSASADWFRLSGLDEAGNDARYVNTSGDTMTGNLILNTDPTSNLQAATKNYVDTSAANSNYVAVAGDTMTGALILNANPTAALGAATKQYVDDKTATITKAGVYSTADTPTAIAAGQKLTFNYWSDRQSFTSDASAVSWSNTNNEFSIGEGTWEFTFSFRNDTSTTPNFIRMWINTTAGASAGTGTRINAASINNADEYTYFRTFYIVAPGTTRYLHFNNSDSLRGRFMQASIEKITN